MHPPDPFDFLDYRTYLDAWFSWKKSRNKRYSHRAFSKRVGSSDPSVLVNILKGRRKLTAAQIEPFVQALGLEGDDAECFRILVRVGQARDDQERSRAWGELAALRSLLRKPEIDSRRVQYLSERIHPTIQTLAECEGARADPAWIGSMLRPPAQAQKVAEAIQLLQELRLLALEDGRLVVKEEVLRTSTTVEDLGTLAFHAESLEFARDVLNQVRAGGQVQHESAFVGFTAAVPAARLRDLRVLLYEHLNRILHQCAEWEGADQVVQIQVQMFPVTDVIDTA